MPDPPVRPRPLVGAGSAAFARNESNTSYGEPRRSAAQTSSARRREDPACTAGLKTRPTDFRCVRQEYDLASTDAAAGPLPQRSHEWAAEVRARLSTLHLSPVRELEIVEELSLNRDGGWV